jgi:tryptophan 2-monooxygenase
MRSATTCPPSGSHPYIDTPDFAYDQWLSFLDQTKKAIGTVARAPAVAIIGGGASGLCAAFELQRAGCAVTVFEQANKVGGRCASDLFGTDTTDIAEMGPMRFPPSEFILDYYLKKLGIVPEGLSNLPEFPDPGVKPTYICYGGEPPAKWLKTPSTPAPAGFEKVHTGWSGFVDNGLLQGGDVKLHAASTIRSALAIGDIATATQYWRAYLKAFGQKTFYTALYEIFTGALGYDIPGGNAWSFSDFDRFGTLGIGSGGFGPLYPIAFMEIFRLSVNGLEMKQRFLQPSSELQNGIRSLPLKFASALTKGPLTSTPISSITGNLSSGFTLSMPSGVQYGPYDRVIVATTTRAMELSLNLAKYGKTALVSPAVAQAIMRTHVISSNKVAALIKNFWANDPSAIRCLQTDNLVRQVYTLDYTPASQPSEDANGVCFISYVWDDDAVKQQAITNGLPTALGVPADASANQKLYTYLLNTIEAIGGDVATWAQHLRPLDGDFANNVIFEEWQSSPYFAGAFKLSQPGQDQYVQAMFFDYQKANTVNDTGVYLAGDCISWTSGWIEGALTPALNAAAGVIQSLGGTLNPDANDKTPMTIQSNRYTYWP